MKKIKWALPLLIVLLNLGHAFSQKPYTLNPNSLIAIVNTNIIDVENGNVSNNMTILIKGNRIINIGSAKKIKIPKQTKVLDGQGKFVIPGLWDMHAHTSSETNTRRVIYPLFIANGITSVRVMSADCYDPCWKLAMNIYKSIELLKEIKNGELIGPRAILGSNYVNGPKPGDSSTVKRPGTEEDGKKLVHFLMGRGVDFIKIYDGIPRDAYFGLASEANKEHFPFAGHNPIRVKTSEASDAGQKSIEHCCEGNLFIESSSREDELRSKYTKLYLSDSTKDLYKVVLEIVKSFDKTKFEKIIQKLMENKTWFVPTLLVEDILNPKKPNWRNDLRNKYVPKDELKYWVKNEKELNDFLGVPDPEIRQKRFEIVRDMQKAGVNILAGSDCGVYGAYYGESLHDELALLVEAGLSNLEALQAATIKAAQYEQATDSLGSIKKGMLADLILLDANPLKNIGNTKRINTVISNGRLFDRKALDAILQKVLIEAAK
ncbi:MAG: amidohydrolase family protein [Bacteroidetes bacterium]|nr:amidohydrolase family protein [Bacteroidota bacterium]